MVLKTILFILSIIALGFMVDIILIGLSYFRERLSQDISFKLKKVPLYFVLGALGYTVYGSLLSINGVMLSVFSFIVFASIVLVLFTFLSVV